MMQLAFLLGDCAALVFLVVWLAAGWLIMNAGFASVSPIVLIFPALLLLMFGYRAVQSLRDLVPGVAAVEEDFLQHAWRSQARGSGYRYYGHFERLGRMHLVQAEPFEPQALRRYRVVYSPASKIVWRVEAL